jgi:hypothetical protein
MKFKSEVQLEALNNATVDTDKFLVSDSSTVKYRTGTQLLSDLGIAGIYVPYTGATGNVDLGTHTLSSYNLIVNHTSGSGVAASITKGGSGEALTINKTSGSGNAMSVTGGLTSLVDLTLSSIPNATIDTDKFIVSDGGAIKYRTGAQVLSDIGGQAALTNPITGTGTLNFVSKFTSTGSTLGDSQIFDNGTDVGIGTSGPLNKVDIVSSNNDSFGAITVRPLNQTQTMSLGWQGVSASLNFIVNTGAVERMRITSSGNVGINTTNPNQKLHVNGATQLGDINATTNFGTVALKVVEGTVSTGPTLGSGAVGAQAVLYSNGAFGMYTGVSSTGSTWMQSQRNDGNTAVYSLLFQPSGGNVGIGTSNPTVIGGDITTLDIRGSGGGGVRSGVSGGSESTFYTIAAGGYLGTISNIPLYLQANNSVKATILASGNVGIGTTIPTYRLQVSDTIASVTAFGNFAALQSIGGTGYRWTLANDSTFRLQYTTNGFSTVTTPLFVTSNGALGVGTTSPVAKLDIGGASGEMIRLADSSTIGNPFITFFQTSTRRAYIQYVDSGDNLTLASEYGGIVLATGTNGNEAEKMRITSSGNVGIGATSPVRALQVGNFSGNPEICIGSGTTGVGGLTFGDGAGGNDPWRGFIQYNHATDAMLIGTSNAGWLTLTNGGALGLNVNPTNTAGRFEASNDIVAYSSSDKRWKTNIKNIDSPLDKISQINGVEFDWIEDEPVHGNKGHDIGVIAQEIENILPDAVQTRESGMKAVKYEKVIPLLIEAIKEQQKQIEELKQLLNGFTK